MKHIILLGDSIFDNAPYVNGGLDVTQHLEQQKPNSWNVTRLAVDGDYIHNVAGQLSGLPEDATHLFVSVGGNDALREMGILEMPANSSAEVFNAVSDVAGAFEERYKSMVEILVKIGKPTTLCTIYNGRFEPARQKVVSSALAAFNDAIIRQAVVAGFPLIDLRLVCSEYEDYANEIEPSVAGGNKIAKTILKVADLHGFAGDRTSVYF